VVGQRLDGGEVRLGAGVRGARLAQILPVLHGGCIPNATMLLATQVYDTIFAAGRFAFDQAAIGIVTAAPWLPDPPVFAIAA
jgi:hypothetical protein